MAGTDAVSGTGSSASSGTDVSRAVKNVLGKDDFLKLLVTQLKYQDPLEPTDNKDLIAQMAQFSSLEQMNNMSASFEKMAGYQESTLTNLTIGQAVGYIGHMVKAEVPSGEEGSTDTTTVSGLVTGMKMIDGVPNVIVNGEPIPVAAVQEVNLFLGDTTL